MPTDHRLTELDTGVRIVTEAMPSVRSVALGFWVGTGSRVEGDGQAGLSHLLEHLLFRGASRYGSLEIDQIFDAMGAEINAGTGKETTSLYSRVLDVHLDRVPLRGCLPELPPRVERVDLLGPGPRLHGRPRPRVCRLRVRHRRLAARRRAKGTRLPGPPRTPPQAADACASRSSRASARRSCMATRVPQRPFAGSRVSPIRPRSASRR